MAAEDASALALRLHGGLLRQAAAVSGLHFAGLHQVARHLVRGGCSNSAVLRRLRHLDDACAVIRHITVVSCDALAVDLGRLLLEVAANLGRPLPEDAVAVQEPAAQGAVVVTVPGALLGRPGCGDGACCWGPRHPWPGPQLPLC